MLTAVQCMKVAELLRDNLTEPPIAEVHEVREERGEPRDVWGLIDALKAQANLINGVEATPASIVTLKVPANNQQTHWCEEAPSRVMARMHDARVSPGDHVNSNGPLIRLTSVRGLKGFDLWTRHDNIVNVEDYR